MDDHACACSHHHDDDPLLKAAGRGGADGIWTPHNNPYLTELCERATFEGQQRLLAAQLALLTALGIESGPPILAKAEGWSPERIALVVKQLRKPLAEYTPDDWIALVDLVIESKLAPAELQDTTDWLLWRAQLAGRLQAYEAVHPNAPQEALLDLVLAANPTRKVVQPTRLRQAWEWAKARVAVHVRQISDNLRARLAGTIIQHIESHGTNQRGLLEQQLRDTFAAANRDWRRIAITEAGEVANTTYLQQFPTGSRVERLEIYDSACPFCQNLHGKVFTWSAEPLGREYGWTHVWPGKTNVGRSSSPRKQTPEGLVERTEDELWWPAAGVQHPHCRGRWRLLPDETLPPGVDPAFADWVKQRLAAWPK